MSQTPAVQTSDVESLEKLGMLTGLLLDEWDAPMVMKEAFEAELMEADPQQLVNLLQWLELEVLQQYAVESDPEYQAKLAKVDSDSLTQILLLLKHKLNAYVS